MSDTPQYATLTCANCGEDVILDDDYEYYGDGTSERRYQLTHAYGYPMCRNNQSSSLIPSDEAT